MPTLKELHDKRAAAIKSARTVREKMETEKRTAMTAEERGQVDGWLKEADDLKKQIDEAQGDESRSRRLEAAEKDLDESRGRQTDDAPSSRRDDPDTPVGGGREGEGRARERGSGETRELTWRVAGGEERSVPLNGPRAGSDYRRDYRQYLRSGTITNLLARSGHRTAEERDLQADSGDTGGYLVAPMQMVGGLLKSVDDMVHIRQLATVHQLTGAKNLGVVSLDADPDDGDWTSELATGSADTAMKFGRREMNPTPVAKRVKISRTLLRLVPDLERMVRERLAYKFAITEEKNFLTGDGSNKPLGVFTAHNSGVPTTRDVSTGNEATLIKADGLIRAKMNLKAQYRNSPSCRWLFHRDAVTQIMLLKDGNGQYLWRQGLTAGDPDTILAKQVLESEYAPNTFTSGLYVGMIADWRYYYIVESLAMEILRINELYAEANQVGFIGRMEVDGMPVLAEAFSRVKLG